MKYDSLLREFLRFLVGDSFDQVRRDVSRRGVYQCKAEIMDEGEGDRLMSDLVPGRALGRVFFPRWGKYRARQSLRIDAARRLEGVPRSRARPRHRFRSQITRERRRCENDLGILIIAQ